MSFLKGEGVHLVVLWMQLEVQVTGSQVGFLGCMGATCGGRLQDQRIFDHVPGRRGFKGSMTSGLCYLGFLGH